MSDSLGLSVPPLIAPSGPDIERIIVQRPLDRVLAFLGRSIDDVCNEPMVKNEVYGFYKLYRQVLRSIEITDLERLWNT